MASVEQVGLSALPPAYRVESTIWTSPDLWYDIDRLREVCPGGIDVLVVDAPPGHSHEHVLVREPAVNALRGHLAAQYSVFLDDTDRPAERETLRRWGDQLGIHTHNLMAHETAFVPRFWAAAGRKPSTATVASASMGVAAVASFPAEAVRRDIRPQGADRPPGDPRQDAHRPQTGLLRHTDRATSP